MIQNFFQGDDEKKSIISSNKVKQEHTLTLHLGFVLKVAPFSLFTPHRRLLRLRGPPRGQLFLRNQFDRL